MLLFAKISDFIEKRIKCDQNKRCRDCIYGHFYKGDSILASGYICQKNPFLKVTMGLEGKCSEREQHKNMENI